MKAWFTLQRKHKQIKTKKNVSGGAFEDKKTVFAIYLCLNFAYAWSYVNVLCHTLDFILLCSPLFSANPYACLVM